MTDDDRHTDPVTLAGHEVTDALVKFQLSCSNSPDLYVYTDEDVTHEDLQPVGSDDIEINDPDAEYWVAHHDGVFRRYKDGKVGVPADERPISQTVEVATTDGRTEDRVPDLCHTTAIGVNQLEDGRATVVNGDVGRFAISARKAHAIVERYINGPLGSDYRSHTFKTREEGRYSWRRLETYTDREDYAEADEVDVVLVRNGRYGWTPRPAIDLPYKDGPGEDDEVLDPDILGELNR